MGGPFMFVSVAPAVDLGVRVGVGERQGVARGGAAGERLNQVEGVGIGGVVAVDVHVAPTGVVVAGNGHVDGTIVAHADGEADGAGTALHPVFDIGHVVLVRAGGDRAGGGAGGGRGRVDGTRVLGVAEDAGLEDRGLVGNGAGGSEAPLQHDVLRRLGHRGRAQRNRQRRQRRGVDVEIAVHAVAQQVIAAGVDQLIVGVHLELAVAGVELLAAGTLHDEHPVALDGQIAGAGTGRDGALAEIRRDVGDHRAQADLGGIGAAVVGRGGGTEALRLRELRGKLRHRGLEADGVRVRQVVADHVDRRFGRVHAGQRRAEGGS